MGEQRQNSKTDRKNSKNLMQKSLKKRTSAARRIRNICVYCGSNPGNNPAYAEAARTLGQDMARGRHRPRLRRRRPRPDGRARPRRARRRAAASPASSRLPVREGAHAARRRRADRRRGHAPAQEADVRQVRRLRRAARRHRHAGGAGRAADLGPARPPRQADRPCQHRRLLGPVPGRCCATCASEAFIRADMDVRFLTRRPGRGRGSPPPPGAAAAPPSSPRKRTGRLRRPCKRSRSCEAATFRKAALWSAGS